MHVRTARGVVQGTTEQDERAAGLAVLRTRPGEFIVIIVRAITLTSCYVHYRKPRTATAPRTKSSPVHASRGWRGNVCGRTRGGQRKPPCATIRDGGDGVGPWFEGSGNERVCGRHNISQRIFPNLIFISRGRACPLRSWRRPRRPRRRTRARGRHRAGDARSSRRRRPSRRSRRIA